MTTEIPPEPVEEATPPSDPMWHDILTGKSGRFGSGRGLLRHLPSSPRCKMCAAPFKGPTAPVMRMMDRGPWAKNPTICGFCFKQLERGRGGADIELSILFADIRGSTGLAERMGPAAFRHLMDRFYREATEALVAHDAIIDKFVGDEVVALFLPVLSPTHAQSAVQAGHDLLRITGHGEGSTPWAPLGIGIHTGNAYVGVVGDTVTDFTALGDSVNVTARLASAAGAGEILVSQSAADAAGLQDDSEIRHLTLRGREQELDVHVLHA